MADDDAVWRALAQGRRREILRLVAEKERTASDIASSFDITRPAVSQHLTALKDAGLLAERREGTRRFYRARLERVATVTRWLRGMGIAPAPAARAAAPRAASKPRASAVVRHTALVNARPPAVWRLLADPEVRRRWKAGPEPEVIELEQGKHISWRWRWAGAGSPAEVKIELQAEGRSTRLDLVHRGPAGERWELYLERLHAVARGWDPGPEAED
jgi:DNA-binding transcriptional ArsR family regulator